MIDDADRNYNLAVGATVRALREVSGMTQDELAVKVGLTASGLSRVETGETALTVSRLRQIARALDVDPWKIIFQADYVLTCTVHEDLDA